MALLKKSGGFSTTSGDESSRYGVVNDWQCIYEQQKSQTNTRVQKCAQKW